MRASGFDEDIAIAGAGLAGASAACHLAQAGRAPLLIERDPEPRHKICGEFISTEAQADLAALGVDLDRCGASMITALRLVHGRTVADADLPFVARGLSRKCLDEAVLARAVSCGACVVRGMSARAIRPDASGVRIETSRPSDIRARTLFLATGKHEVRGAKRPTFGTADDLIAFKTYFALTSRQRAALEQVIEIILFAGGYAGLQLVEDGMANLCLLVSRRRFDAVGKTWAALLRHLRETSPHLADRLHGASAILDRPLSIYRIPYGFLHMPHPGEPQNLFRLGDQVGVIPSFAGDGMAIALHSGRLAASVYLAQGNASSVFHHRVRRDLQRQIRCASLVHQAGCWSWGRHALVKTCRAWPSVARLIAASTRISSSALRRAQTLS